MYLKIEQQQKKDSQTNQTLIIFKSITALDYLSSTLYCKCIEHLLTIIFIMLNTKDLLTFANMYEYSVAKRFSCIWLNDHLLQECYKKGFIVIMLTQWECLRTVIICCKSCQKL